MTLETRQLDTDKRDYYREAIAYLNAHFTTQEAMEQRIAVHLLDYCQQAGAMLDEPRPGEFVIYGRGLLAPKVSAR
jgi:hypothetical protein